MSRSGYRPPVPSPLLGSRRQRIGSGPERSRMKKILLLLVVVTIGLLVAKQLSHHDE